jgi:hypothetical protein
MKALSLLIWLSWTSVCLRVLLAPVFRLTLKEALVLLLACAPSLGFCAGCSPPFSGEA